MEINLSKKGKDSLNILINAVGKKKARKIFYSLEKKRPDMVKAWRKHKANCSYKE